MTVLIASKLGNSADWADALHQQMPELEIILPDDLHDPAAVDVAVVWRPDPGLLSRLPKLRYIQNLGAGVDGLLADPSFPRHIPLARIVDPGQAEIMAEYVTLHVLRYHRQMAEMALNQSRKTWKWLPPVPASERRIGIMGGGVMGQAAALKLQSFGFQVMTWSRSLKALPGIASFHGPAHLDGFLKICDVLVCLLPLTDATREIICRRSLSLMPRGVYIINAGRGGHVNEADLLHALDNEWVSGATLDVFAEEPLPEAHPFWTHPRVTVTPHNAADSVPARVVPQIIENIRRVRQGLKPHNLVDMKAGY